MKFCILFTILTFLVPSPSHDIPMGIFSLNFEEQEILMDIKLEAEDMEKAVITYYNKKSTDRLVEQYILQHTAWYFDDLKITPNLCYTEKQKEHYILNMSFSLPTSTITKMKIINKCLLQEIENQSNIIYINQYGEQRGFRLHKDRIQTTFELM